jgi:hypothetical protein
MSPINTGDTAMTILEYTVRGVWPFPLDMLRHDDSAPASEDDRLVIQRLSGDYAPDAGAFKPVDIKLAMVGSWSSFPRPNTKRWKSFGWTVVDDPYAPFEQAERKQSELRRSALAKLTPEEREALGLNDPA